MDDQRVHKEQKVAILKSEVQALGKEIRESEFNQYVDGRSELDGFQMNQSILKMSMVVKENMTASVRQSEVLDESYHSDDYRDNVQPRDSEPQKEQPPV